MHFTVYSGIPTLAGNALLAGDRRATHRQTPQEHADLLDITTLPNYQAMLRANPAAIAMLMPAFQAEAELREQQDPRYWEDALPRRQVSQSSSFIGDWDYDPDTQNLQVLMNGRAYSFPGFTPEHVAEWINSPSLGKYFNQNLKGQWG